MQRNKYDCAPPVRTCSGPWARPAVETPLEQELRKRLYDVQRNLRGQMSANQDQQQRLRELQLLLKKKDSEIQVLQGQNQQLLDDKTAIMEYGKQLWKDREQEMADAVALGVVQVKQHIDNLEEQNNSLQEQIKNQAQRSPDGGIVQELDSAYTMIQELEETLKEKDYQLQIFHMEFFKVSEDKERLQEQVEKLLAEQAMTTQLQEATKEAGKKDRETIQQLREQVEKLQDEKAVAAQLQVKEAENSQKLFKKQQELEETLRKKDHTLEKLRLKFAQTSEDKQTIVRLNEELERVKAERQSHDQALHTQRSSLELALAEQRQRAAEAEKKVEELERSLQTEHKNIQVLSREKESQKVTFEEALKGFYSSYGTLMEDKEHQEEKVKELSAELHSCEALRTSVLHRCEELQSRAEELQLALDQTKQKKRKRWFKLWH